MTVDTYHGQEETKLWINGHNVPIRKEELCLSLLLCSEDNVDLLGSHRQHGELNPIELVKATPRT